MSHKSIKWYMQPKVYDDVVVSSGISLSRNLADFDFRDKISNEDAAKLVEKVRGLTAGIAGRECTDYYSCNVNKLPEGERAILVEFRTISSEIADKKQPTGLIISDDESVSIMINEEDHIRIHAVAAGNNMREVYKLADRIDDFIDSELQYAYSDRYGYLTTCMSDVGTGMKAEYVLSLPALSMSSKINSIRDEIGKFGVVIKDVYSEDGKNSGYLYSLSNQKTLGLSEQEIIENLEQIVGQVVALERKRRLAWVENEKSMVEDKVYRSYGVLKYTRLMGCKDAMTLLAQLKFGSDAGIITLSGNGAGLYRLMMEIQPANINKMFRCGNDRQEIDRARAKYINEKLPEILIEQ